jgi:hypothetical protein
MRAKEPIMAKKFGRIVLTEPAAIVKTIQPAQEVKFKEARQLLCFLKAICAASSEPCQHLPTQAS